MGSNREPCGWRLPSREAALHAFDKSKDTLCSGGNSIPRGTLAFLQMFIHLYIFAGRPWLMSGAWRRGEREREAARGGRRAQGAADHTPEKEERDARRHWHGPRGYTQLGQLVRPFAQGRYSGRWPMGQARRKEPGRCHQVRWHPPWPGWDWLGTCALHMGSK